MNTDTDTDTGPALLAAWGRALRDERNRQGLSQLEVASRAGIAQSTLSAIEAGKHPASVIGLVSICAALGHRPGRLLRWPAAPKAGR